MRWFILFLPACLASGCDMADYQRRMDQTRARLKAFDEENRVLGKDMKMPKIEYKDGTVEDGFPFNVFLRLPKTVSAQMADVKDFGILYYEDTREKDSVIGARYPGEVSGYAVFAAAAFVSAPEKEEEKKKKKNVPWTHEPERFVVLVWSAVRDYYRDSEYRGVLSSPEPKKMGEPIEGVTPRGDKGAVLRYDIYEFDGSNTKDKGHMFVLYHHHTSEQQVAIIFQVPTDKYTAEEKETIKKSMRTLALDDAARVRRLEFQKTHRASASK